MDIVLATAFGNPNLPIAPIPGFFDDFNRPEANSLGTTWDGKPWEYGWNNWTLTGNGTATGPTSGSSTWAAVDALTSDGTLTAHIAAEPSQGADLRFGLAVRVVDFDNYIWIATSTNNTLTVYVHLDGSTDSSTPISGQSLSTGDTLAATLQGTTLSVARNGTQVHQQTVTEHVSATRHGFYANINSDAEWDWIEFTP